MDIDKSESGGGKLPEKIDLGKESAIEAEVLAARQRAIIPLEERMKEFRGMLAEKEVRSRRGVMKHYWIDFIVICMQCLEQKYAPIINSRTNEQAIKWTLGAKKNPMKEVT